MRFCPQMSEGFTKEVSSALLYRETEAEEGQGLRCNQAWEEGCMQMVGSFLPQCLSCICLSFHQFFSNC